ncbi:MAG: glucose-1-phosphate thymidylyltransferase [Candidatus Wallbacteria bacterium]|nr:glucose-1-phosphate thymidylyltransferase [Candidatus Wallbacteria bacterium]
MKGLLLSGGRGTRLRPITHTSAKQLVPVANKPVLFYGIEALRDAGITDIGIIVGDTQEEIRRACGDGARFGVKLTYIHQAEPLGLAHAVLTAREYLADSDFVMYLGDNLIISGIKELVHKYQTEKSNAMVLLARVPNPNQFGVAELKDGKVFRLVEKPKEPKSDLALVGVYMFDKLVMKAASSIQPSARGELEITDAIQWLVDQGHRVNPHIVTGWWKDTGKLEDMLEANRMILATMERRIAGSVDAASCLEDKVVIEEGAQIVNSTIRGPAIIGRNTRIENSYVGPFTSIYYNCLVRSSEIEHSILLEESKVLDIRRRIEDSLIGKNVTISRSPARPKALRFMLGDNSSVGVS